MRDWSSEILVLLEGKHELCEKFDNPEAEPKGMRSHEENWHTE